MIKDITGQFKSTKCRRTRPIREVRVTDGYAYKQAYLTREVIPSQLLKPTLLPMVLAAD